MNDLVQTNMPAYMLWQLAGILIGFPTLMAVIVAIELEIWGSRLFKWFGRD